MCCSADSWNELSVDASCIFLFGTVERFLFFLAVEIVDVFEDHQPLKACVTSDEEVLLAVDCLVQAFHSDELANVVVTMNRAEVTVLMTIFAAVPVLTVHLSEEKIAISVFSCSLYN